MKLKGVLLAGAAIIVCGLSNPAQADDRLSVYEINSFVSKLTSAINNPNPTVGRSFLHNNVSSNATFRDSINNAWVDGRLAYQAYNGYYPTSVYYRYPYAYNGYLQPTSFQTLGKVDLINAIDHKKTLIPRYHQSITVLGTRMPADASSAVLDVRLKEFGLSYALAPYGTHYGHKVEHSDARCALHLRKTNGDIMLTKMDCNTVMRAPI